MSPQRIVIAAGGTGGHMFPAQALAETLLARGWKVTLSTDARGARYATGFPEAVTIEEIPAATFARGGLGAKLLVPFRIGAGIVSACLKLRRDRPDIVVGFGGYPTIPALSAAVLLSLPRVLHEQNGVLGRVNAVFAKRVQAVACGTWPTDLPEGANGVHVGNPVRAKVLERAGAAYIPPGDHPMRLVVIGGSQGARILSDVVPKAIASLPEVLKDRLTVIQQARAEDEQRVREAYDAAGVRAKISPFIEDLPRQFAEAQLVISRAGASSLADLTVIGRPSILVPYAAATSDHQTANAKGLADVGAALIMQEQNFTAPSLTQAISEILSGADDAAQAAIAALSYGKPNAADDLADLVETFAQKGATS